MTVVSLVQHRGRDTVKLLEAVLARAYQEGGSVTLAYCSPKGEEHVGATGIYARDELLATAAIRRAVISGGS